MSAVRKNKVIMLGIFICLLLASVAVITFSIGNSSTAFAAENKTVKDLQNIESVTRKIFGYKKICAIENLYNYDDSADYIYVDFADYGYAVFLSDTLELLEYSAEGSLPYLNTLSTKYYGGPTNYLTKVGERFVNVVSGEFVSYSVADAATRSKEIRTIFSAEKSLTKIDEQPKDALNHKEVVGNTPGNKPQPSTFIAADLPGSSQTTYIPNANYFTSAPFRGNNNAGTCSAVAIQLLLSYHNYYTDRRIIDNQFLLGNNNNPADMERNPNFCVDPRSIGVVDATTNFNETIGSNEAFHHLLANDYSLGDSSVSSIDTKTKNYLKDKGGLIFTVNSVAPLWGALYLSNGDYNNAKAEINAGRPIYLAARTGNSSSDWNHAMVAYGYQNLNDTTHTGGNDQFGFIVDYGWGSGSVNRWINAGWTYSYTTVNINHAHSYASTSTVLNGSEIILSCTTCGHRTVDTLFIVSGSILTRLKHALTSLTAVKIPSVINGVTITAIGSSAFANQTKLSQILIPSSVTSIGDNAFFQCVGLKRVAIPISVKSMGRNVFYDCPNLSVYVEASNRPNGWHPYWTNSSVIYCSLSENLFHIETYEYKPNSAIIQDNTMTFNTTENTEMGNLKLQIYNDTTFLYDTHFFVNAKGEFSSTFTIEQEGNNFSFGRNGNFEDSKIRYLNGFLRSGVTYKISFEVVTFEINSIVIKNIIIVPILL